MSMFAFGLVYIFVLFCIWALGKSFSIPQKLLMSVILGLVTYFVVKAMESR